MKKETKNEFITKELEAIYEEYEIYVNQLVMLKPFLKDLIFVINGENPTYKLSEIIKNKK